MYSLLTYFVNISREILEEKRIRAAGADRADQELRPSDHTATDRRAPERSGGLSRADSAASQARRPGGQHPGRPGGLRPHQAAIEGHARTRHPDPRWASGSDRVREQDCLSEMPGLSLRDEGPLPFATCHGRREKRDRRYPG